MTLQRNDYAALLVKLTDLIGDMARNGDLPPDLAIARLTPETTVAALGLDSLGKLTLLTAVDEKLGLYIPDDQISGSTTLGALAERILRARRHWHE